VNVLRFDAVAATRQARRAIGWTAAVGRETAAAAVRAAIRESAIRDADGFEAAWRKVELVPGWLPEATAAVFWGLVAELRPSRIIEIGTYQGRSAALFGLALQRFAPDGRVVTIDPHSGGVRLQGQLGAAQPSTAALAEAHLQGLQLVPDPVEIRIATSDEAAAAWHDEIDLAYIDGWHTWDAARRDGLNWGRHLSSNGLLCFDDARSIPDVRRGARDASNELGLTWYGTLLGQAWAGRRPTPPAVLARATRWRWLRAR
jgi:predicted O-methyltransferase YrrM